MPALVDGPRHRHPHSPGRRTGRTRPEPPVVFNRIRWSLSTGIGGHFRPAYSRRTRDLDFFGPEPDRVDLLVPVVIQAITDLGFDVNVVRQAHGFARLEVRSGDERTEVDLAADARLLPPERGPVGPMLAAEELAVDKVLAVFGRAEARDFVDLAAVEGRYGLDRLCRLASEKDGGFDPGVLAEMMERFDRLPRDEFELGDAAYQRLAARVGRWREVALGLVANWRQRGTGDIGLGL